MKNIIDLKGFTFSENISSSVSGGGQYASAASESLARRAQATVQDPVFHKMKGQFTTDFDFIQLGAMKLHNLIHKLKKWIKILEARVKLLPKYVLMLFTCNEDSNNYIDNEDLQRQPFLIIRMSLWKVIFTNLVKLSHGILVFVLYLIVVLYSYVSH